MPKSARFQESSGRSIFKSFTFRVVVIVSDAIIGFALTHRYDLTAGFVVFTNIASTILYFLHERLWTNVRWGRKRKK